MSGNEGEDNLYQTLQREADVLELVWGHAFLACKIEDTTIRRPVCTTRLELKFDERSGVFSLQPAGYLGPAIGTYH